ncbi:hypothetical protein [Capnocytophaga sputigena]|uniref:hypothetical protein n=1 Tax=Capnocytophaga sputigena TaxID=1019 RepID=UPI0028D182E9|nr:hypothetical protein [Capnocytophaga sputigena]
MEERYAYIQKENGERIDISNYYREFPHQNNLSIPSIKEEGILKTNATQIFLQENNFTAIEAPNATRITDEESPLLERVEAPNCRYLFLCECDKLKEQNISVAEGGNVIKRIGGEYYNNAEKIDDHYLYGKEDDITVSLIAPNAVEIQMRDSVVLEKVYAPNCEILNCTGSHLLKEENIIVDEDCHIYLYNKEIIRDAIIVLNTEENYGNKSLIDIGLTSEKNFDGEDETYSILCSKKELREVLNYSKTEQELKNFIYKKLGSTNWNDFKYNPNSLKIRDKISEIAIDLKGAYAFIEKENGEKIDVSENIRNMYFYQRKNIELIIDKEQEEGKLVTNVLSIECNNSNITSIEALEARNIFCENCENLEKIEAPECTEIHCEGSPLLSQENIDAAYNCEIEGLEKRNQLKI